jgi:hypothetical protein
MGGNRRDINIIMSFIWNRAKTELVNVGLASMNSPIELTVNCVEAVMPFLTKFIPFYATVLKKYPELHGEELDKALFMEFEEKFGGFIVEHICIPMGVNQGACLLAIIKSCQNSMKEWNSNSNPNQEGKWAMPDVVGTPGIAPETADIPIPVRAYLGPIILEIPAKPAQVAVVVRMATQELLAAGIISGRGPPTDAERVIAAAQAAQSPSPQPSQQEPSQQQQQPSQSSSQPPWDKQRQGSA